MDCAYNPSFDSAFRRIRDGAMPGLEIVFADKKTPSAGLQLADLTARPIGCHALSPTQSNRAWDIIEPKSHCSPQGEVSGWGPEGITLKKRKVPENSKASRRPGTPPVRYLEI